MKDEIRLWPIGFVRQRLVDTGQVLRDTHNLCVDSAIEIMAMALWGQAAIGAVAFGNTGGRAVTTGLRSIGTPVGKANVSSSAVTPNYISQDDRGLRSIITFSAVLTPTKIITYDTLALVSNLNNVFAATNFPAVTLNVGQAVAVEWTILLRGK